MVQEILGIHHATAIAGDAQQNVDFYSGLLGMHLVKLTVNFDDPGTYHLYFGDEMGRPGSVMTFFPWPGAPRGRRGSGQVTTGSFSVPETSLGYWTERFKTHRIAFESPTVRFEEEVLVFHDPDGLELELVAHAGADGRDPWVKGPVPPEYAIRGFHGVTLAERDPEAAASLLVNSLGFRLVGSTGNRLRYQVGAGGPGALIDLLAVQAPPQGVVGVGSVHHVAWRVVGDEEQRVWRRTIAAAGVNVTPVMDRKYFHSIYFREPGGALFEIATDSPGFAVDESIEDLGTRLMLPGLLEPRRDQIQQTLPRLTLPAATRGNEAATLTVEDDPTDALTT